MIPRLCAQKLTAARIRRWRRAAQFQGPGRKRTRKAARTADFHSREMAARSTRLRLWRVSSVASNNEHTAWAMATLTLGGKSGMLAGADIVTMLQEKIRFATCTAMVEIPRGAPSCVDVHGPTFTLSSRSVCVSKATTPHQNLQQLSLPITA